MSYVICSPSAATPIKCYDPDLIVLPLLRTGREQLHHAAGEQSDETLAAEGIEAESSVSDHQMIRPLLLFVLPVISHRLSRSSHSARHL